MLVYVVLTRVYNSCSLSSLYTSAFKRAVMNEPKQLSISNQHIRVPRRHAFNFAQVPFRCMLVMPSNSVINAEVKKKSVWKSIDV